jgi:hypothetical protein
MQSTTEMGSEVAGRSGSASQGWATRKSADYPSVLLGRSGIQWPYS